MRAFLFGAAASLVVIFVIAVFGPKRGNATEQSCSEPPGIHLDDPQYFFAKILADSCTSDPTTPELIEQVEWQMAHCNGGISHCLRHVCKKMILEDAASTSTPQVIP